MGEEIRVPMSQSEWVKQVKEIIENKRSLASAAEIPRVATALLDAKPEAYIPGFVSLGPYHHWKQDKKIAASSSARDRYKHSELKMSTAEVYKVESAVTFWRSRNMSFDEIVNIIKEKWQVIEKFYDLPMSKDGDYPEHFTVMMAIDSSFLLHFLFTQCGTSHDGRMQYLSRHKVSIKCDILKLENQIPLAVLLNVFDIAKKALNDPRYGSFGELLQKTCKELSPFGPFDIAMTQVNDQPHLLGYVHAVVSPFVRLRLQEIDQEDWSQLTLFQKMKHSLELVVKVVVAAVFTILCVKHPANQGRYDILNSYNARELERGGIKFKPFSAGHSVIRFDKYSGTLHLPQITVSETQTEVFFRNMLALEFNDTARDNSVTRYIGLMDCLIDKAEDVRLLRESQIILRPSVMLTDEDITGIWNGMCHSIFRGHLEPLKDLNSALKEVLIRKYYMSIVNKVLWEFYWDHLSKPGKGVALLVGTLLLIMTILQTYYTWSSWDHDRKSGGSHSNSQQ